MDRMDKRRITREGEKDKKKEKEKKKTDDRTETCRSAKLNGGIGRLEGWS